jgi:hypothetical protein
MLNVSVCIHRYKIRQLCLCGHVVIGCRPAWGRYRFVPLSHGLVYCKRREAMLQSNEHLSMQSRYVIKRVLVFGAGYRELKNKAALSDIQVIL